MFTVFCFFKAVDNACSLRLTLIGMQDQTFLHHLKCNSPRYIFLSLPTDNTGINTNTIVSQSVVRLVIYATLLSWTNVFWFCTSWRKSRAFTSEENIFNYALPQAPDLNGAPSLRNSLKLSKPPIKIGSTEGIKGLVYCPPVLSLVKKIMKS